MPGDECAGDSERDEQLTLRRWCERVAGGHEIHAPAVHRGPLARLVVRLHLLVVRRDRVPIIVHGLFNLNTVVILLSGLPVVSP